MGTHEALHDLIEGRLSSAGERRELVRLASRLIIEEGLEAEVRDALGRDYYERGAEPGQGFRKGLRQCRLKTAEGTIECAAQTSTAAPHRANLGADYPALLGLDRFPPLPIPFMRRRCRLNPLGRELGIGIYHLACS